MQNYVDSPLVGIGERGGGVLRKEGRERGIMEKRGGAPRSYSSECEQSREKEHRKGD